MKVTKCISYLAHIKSYCGYLVILQACVYTNMMKRKKPAQMLFYECLANWQISVWDSISHFLCHKNRKTFGVCSNRNSTFSYIFGLVDFIPPLPHDFIVVDHQTSNRHLSVLQSIFGLQRHINRRSACYNYTWTVRKYYTERYYTEGTHGTSLCKLVLQLTINCNIT